MSDLKPCPFCGSDKITVEWERCEPLCDGDTNRRWFAECTQCSCQGPFCQKEPEVALKWNNQSRLAAAEKFKTFVHSYLDQHGVAHGDPENQHQKEGCRIGARLDLMFARTAAAEKERDELKQDASRYHYLRTAVPKDGELCVFRKSYDGLHAYLTPDRRGRIMDAELDKLKGEK
jgi:hypothetical protein